MSPFTILYTLCDESESNEDHVYAVVSHGASEVISAFFFVSPLVLIRINAFPSVITLGITLLSNVLRLPKERAPRFISTPSLN